MNDSPEMAHALRVNGKQARLHKKQLCCTLKDQEDTSLTAQESLADHLLAALEEWEEINS